MDGPVHLNADVLVYLANNLDLAEIHNDTLVCKTKIGLVECEIDVHGVAWIYQVTTEESLWWHGKCRIDELLTSLKNAVKNANQ